MASFGEALSKSFVDTFGAMNRARYIGAITNRIASEQAGEDAYKADLEAQSKAHGVALPGAQPAAAPQAPAAPAPQAPAAPTPVSAIAAAQTPAAAPAAPAPQPPAAAPPAAAPPAAAPPAAAPPAAPVPAPSAMAAAQAPAPQTPPAPQQMGGQEGGQSPFDPQTTAKIIEFVENAKDPVVTMVAAGAMQSGKPPQPGEFQALRAQVPGLIAAVQDARGGGQREITKADWNGFLEKMTLSAMKNLTPQQQQQALGTIDKIRTVGLQSRLAVAMTAARSGDMQGAADALNGANAFLPDGYNSRFKVVNGGIQITRTAEDGKGEAATRVLTPQEIETHAMSLMDPAGTVRHLLNEKIHTEAVRHNKVTEGHAAANIGLRGRELEFNQNLRADAAKLKREQDDARKEQDRADAAGVTAVMAYSEAAAALRAVDPKKVSPGTLANLREAAAKAREGMVAASMAMSGQGAQRAAGLRATLDANADRDANEQEKIQLRRDQAAGRAPLSSAQETRFFDQADLFLTEHTADKTTAPSAHWAMAQGLAVYGANPQVPPRTILDALKRFRDTPTQDEMSQMSESARLKLPAYAAARQAGADAPTAISRVARPDQMPARITDPRSGVTIRMPGVTSEQDNIKPGMRPPEGNDPVAPVDKPATPGALTSLMGAAAPPAPSRPDRTPEDQRRIEAGARRAGGDPNNVVSAPSMSTVALRAAVGALAGKPASPGRIAAVARQYGVDLDALNRALGDPSAR